MKLKVRLHFGPNLDYINFTFDNQKECDEFLDQLFQGGYGYAELSKKLYVNMANINYLTFEE